MELTRAKLIQLVADNVTAFDGEDLSSDLHEFAEECLAELFKREALSAGIPLSVIEGRSKLSDHFSAEYIRNQCNPNDETKETENE